MPQFKKTAEPKSISQPVKFPEETVILIDWYRNEMGLKSRNAAVNDIITRFFNKSAGISPAVLAVAQKTIENIDTASTIAAMTNAKNVDEIVDTLFASIRPQFVSSIQSFFNIMYGAQSEEEQSTNEDE